MVCVPGWLLDGSGRVRLAGLLPVCDVSWCGALFDDWLFTGWFLVAGADSRRDGWLLFPGVVGLRLTRERGLDGCSPPPLLDCRRART